MTTTATTSRGPPRTKRRPRGDRKETSKPEKATTLARFRIPYKNWRDLGGFRSNATMLSPDTGANQDGRNEIESSKATCGMYRALIRPIRRHGRQEQRVTTPTSASSLAIPLTYTGVGWQSHFIDKVVYEMARAQGLPFPTQAWDCYEMARATLAGYPSGCQRIPKQLYKMAWVTFPAQHERLL